jgi:hypothetical protein
MSSARQDSWCLTTAGSPLAAAAFLTIDVGEVSMWYA